MEWLRGLGLLFYWTNMARIRRNFIFREPVFDTKISAALNFLGSLSDVSEETYWIRLLTLLMFKLQSKWLCLLFLTFYRDMVRSFWQWYAILVLCQVIVFVVFCESVLLPPSPLDSAEELMLIYWTWRNFTSKSHVYVMHTCRNPSRLMLLKLVWLRWWIGHWPDCEWEWLP